MTPCQESKSVCRRWQSIETQTLVKLSCVMVKRNRGKQGGLEWPVIENSGRKQDFEWGVETPVVVPGAQ